MEFEKKIQITAADGTIVEIQFGDKFEQLAVEKYSIESNWRSNEDCIRQMVLDQIKSGLMKLD